MTEYYIIPYIPDGYEEAEPANITVTGADFYWINNYGSKIVFSQSTSSGFTSFDSEGGEVKEITVNEISVLYCDNGNTIFCIWNEKGRFFELFYPRYLGEEYIHKVAGKLEDTEPISLS